MMIQNSSEQPVLEIRKKVNRNLKIYGRLGLVLSALGIILSLLLRVDLTRFIGFILLMWSILFPFGLIFVFKWIYKRNLYTSDISTVQFKTPSVFEALSETTLVATPLNFYGNFDDLYIKTIASFDQIHELTAYHGQSKIINKLIQTILLCRESGTPIQNSKNAFGKGLKDNIPYQQLEEKFAMSYEELSKQWPVCLAFSDELDRSGYTTVHSEQDSTLYQIMYRGEVETVLERCTHILTAQGVVALEKSHIGKIMSQYQKCSNQIERMWAYGFKTSYVMPQPKNGFGDYSIEENLIFLGLMSVYLPLQSPVKTNKYKRILLSEESSRYMQSVGKHVGLLDSEFRLLDQQKLKQMTNEELMPRIDHYLVYSGLQDSDMVRILSLFKRKKNKILLVNEQELPQRFSELCHTVVIEEHNHYNNTIENGNLAPAQVTLTALDHLISSSIIFKATLLKLIQFFFTVHLTEAIVLPLATMTYHLNFNLQQIVLLNFILMPVQAIALFMASTNNERTIVTDSFRVPFRRRSIKPAFWLSFYFLIVLVSNVIDSSRLSTGYYLLLLIGLISYSYMLLFPQGLLLRKITFNNSTINVSFVFCIAVMTLLSVVPVLRNFMHFQVFSLPLYYQIFILGITPIILRDVYRSAKFYWDKITHLKIT